MSRTIWVVGCHHFGHVNSLKFTHDDGKLIRGAKFSSVEEMDETMIERHNSRVKPTDKCWFLGDLTFNMPNFKKNILPRLNGHLRITVGNHDNIRELAHIGRFQKVQLEYRYLGKLMLEHKPTNPSQLYNWRSKTWMNCVHAHIHQRLQPDGPEGQRYFNVCVEQTDYYPVELESFL